MLKSFGANKFTIFTKVIFPNNILNILFIIFLFLQERNYFSSISLRAALRLRRILPELSIKSTLIFYPIQTVHWFHQSC